MDVSEIFITNIRLDKNYNGNLIVNVRFSTMDDMKVEVITFRDYQIEEMYNRLIKLKKEIK